MSNQEHSIRFIDSEYNEKFRISDGDRILIHTRDGGRWSESADILMIIILKSA